jgi:hypothetical protein
MSQENLFTKISSCGPFQTVNIIVIVIEKSKKKNKK